MFPSRFINDLKSQNLISLDIGARGGVDDELVSIGRAIRTIGFEPEPVEAERLSKIKDDRWAEISILPYAIGGLCGTAPLYIPSSSDGASLLKPNDAMLDEYGYDALHDVKKTIEVNITTLDALRTEGRLEHVDYLKLDVEGAEVEVLKGAEQILKTVSIIKLEVSFVPQRISQPLIWEVVSFLKAKGFDVIDVMDIRRWRRRPVPAHPFRSCFEMPYSKGRVTFCDLLLFRNLDLLNNERMQIAQLAIAAGLGYFDQAIGVLRRFRVLDQQWRVKHGYGLEETLRQASFQMGRSVGWKDLKTHLRQTVPRLHSLLTGISFSKIYRPY